MALQQTKVKQIRVTKKTLHKNDLAIELKIPVATINEYILGDKEMPRYIKIIPDKNGIVNVEYSTEVEVPKYEGIYFNELRNGDKTFYIVYKDLQTNKKIDLKIGKESQGITEKYCVNERRKILEMMRLGENPTKIKSKRVFKNIISLDMAAEQYHEDRKLYMTKTNLKDAISL